MTLDNLADKDCLLSATHAPFTLSVIYFAHYPHSHLFPFTLFMFTLSFISLSSLWPYPIPTIYKPCVDFHQTKSHGIFFELITNLYDLELSHDSAWLARRPCCFWSCDSSCDVSCDFTLCSDGGCEDQHGQTSQESNLHCGGNFCLQCGVKVRVSALLCYSLLNGCSTCLRSS